MSFYAIFNFFMRLPYKQPVINNLKHIEKQPAQDGRSRIGADKK
jgi:hypothetical protein